MIRCSQCGLDKPLTDFAKSKRRRSRQSYCKPCAAIWLRAWRFGLTKLELKEILQAAIVCGACGQELEHKRRCAVHIDHDHRTGKIRGVLCRACNVALGQLGDDLTRIQALAKYILNHRGETSGV